MVIPIAWIESEAIVTTDNRSIDRTSPIAVSTIDLFRSIVALFLTTTLARWLYEEYKQKSHRLGSA